MLPNPEVKEVTLQDYINIFQKRIKLILAILVIIPTVTAIYTFTIQPVYRATVSVLMEKTAPRVTKIEEVTPAQYNLSQEFYQTQYRILTSRALAERTFEALRLSKDPEFSESKDPVGKLNGMIKIEPVRNSQIVLLHVEDTDPLRASSIANMFAKSYIQEDIETRNRASKEAAAWLESQLVGIREKMKQSEEALNKYVQENRIVTAADMEKKAQYLLESLKQSKARIETEIAEAAKRYKEKHPRMIALKAKLADIEKGIEKETNDLLDLNQRMVQYNFLKKEAQSSQQLYTSLLTRAKETVVTEKLKASSIRIIDDARPPRAPFKPQKLQSIIIALFFSLFLGIVISLFLEYLDSSVRTADDVSVYLNLPFLGYIPTADKEAKTEAEKGLLCFRNPKSPITEAYRAIRTSILFASPEDKPLKNILITSSFPQEGKSFTTSNISTIFSQVNERIILLDIDMRRPKIHKLFGLEQGNGLSNFLTGNISLDSIIKTTSVPNLSMITSGTIPPNPSELLTSAKIRLLFEDLKAKFDRIIIDSPPILSAADTSLLANMVDGVILVVKGGSTRIDAVVRAKQKLLEARAKIIGVIINNLDPEKEDRYYYYHYYASEEDKQSKRKQVKEKRS